jgi:hypothetical protein
MARLILQLFRRDFNIGIKVFSRTKHTWKGPPAEQETDNATTAAEDR